jgi:hypothetical protein
MNRKLIVPAAGCLVAFLALLAALHGASGRESAGKPRADDGTIAASLSENSPDDRDLMSVDAAEQVLTSLSGEYLRPWRNFESSPRHLYSRAAPRSIPTILANVELPRQSVAAGDSLLVATITVTAGDHSEKTPCVIDRLTKRVRLFSEGEWIASEEWLKKAPVPSGRRAG